MSVPTARRRRKQTARALAEKFGVSERTVQRLVAEERGTYEDRAAERRAQIVEMHRQGMKGTSIAAELSVTPGLVYKRLKEAREAGVDLTPYPREAS